MDATREIPRPIVQEPAASKERPTHLESTDGVVGCSVQPPNTHGEQPPEEEEDKVEEIHREETQPQTVQIFVNVGLK